MQAHQQALNIFEEQQDTQGMAETLDLLGMTYGMRGDRVKAVHQLGQAIALFRSLGNTQSLATSLAMRTIQSNSMLSETTFHALRTYDECMQDAAEALRLAQQMDSPPGQSFAERAVAGVFTSFGQLGPALSHAQEALRIATEIEHQEWRVAAYYNIGHIYLQMLAPTLALQALETGLSLAWKLNSALWIAWLVADQAQAYVLKQELPRAEATLTVKMSEKKNSTRRDLPVDLLEEKHRTLFRNRYCDSGKLVLTPDKEDTMTKFTLLAPTTRAALLADLEGLWQRFDELVGTLGPDDWSGKHGKHWTFTDVPYHLAYFDLDVIATAIKHGLNVPTSEQVLRTEAEQDAWNEIKFTQRPAGSTPQQCLEQMWTSRQAIRNAIAGLSEADLDRLVFIPLVGLGWVSVRVALETCYSHTWNHFMQLRFWMKCHALTPSPEQTHRALSYFMASFAENMDRQQAAQTSLTTVMELSGPGGGVWTLHVADGICRISEGRAAPAELVIIQSPETFVRTRTGIENPTLALWTGKIKVRGWGNLVTFEKLFPIKSLDFAPAPVKTLNVRMSVRAELLMQTNVA